MVTSKVAPTAPETAVKNTAVEPTENEQAAEGPWWRHSFRMFQTNLRETDADLDVEAVLDSLEEYGANAWLLSVGGIISQYPSRLPFQTVNPWLARRPSGDLVGDAVAAAARRGVRMLARMDFSKIATAIATEHPEWCYVSPVGELQEYQQLVSVCPSGAYYQERTFEILDEVMENYPVDGFFFNWFGFNEVDYSSVYRGPCHCVSCLRAFEQYSGGLPHPSGPESDTYELWRRFTAETITELSARLRSRIAQRLPDAALILGRSADIVFHEANNHLHRVQWPFATEEAVSGARSWRPDVPVLVNSVSFLDMPYRMAAEQPERFAHYQVQSIARGGNPSTYIMGVPGQIPYELSMASDVVRYHRRWQEVYDRIDPVAVVGLVLPDAYLGTAADRQDRIAEFRGLYQALQQRHVPFDVIPQDAIKETDLRRYRLVLLGDLGPLPADVASTIDRFVEAGGSILVTGSTAVDADGGVQLRSLPADQLHAVVDSPELLKSTYVAPDGPVRGTEFGASTRYPGPIVPVYGAYRYFRWKDGAEKRFALLARAPFGPPEKAYGNVRINHPGWATIDHGRGRAAIFPWTIGRAYHDLGLTAIRDLVLDAVTEHLPDLPVTALAHEQLEIVVGRTRFGIIVHVLNFSGWRGNNFGPALPCDGVTLVVTADGDAPPACQALVRDQECVVERRGSRWLITVPPVSLFEAVLIQDPDPESGLTLQSEGNPA